MANRPLSRLFSRRRAQPPDPDDETLRESMSTVGLKGQGVGAASSQFISPVFSDIAPSKAELEKIKFQEMQGAYEARGVAPAERAFIQPRPPVGPPAGYELPGEIGEEQTPEQRFREKWLESQMGLTPPHVIPPRESPDLYPGKHRLMKADIAKGAQWRWDKYGNKIPTGESIGSSGQYQEYKTRE